MPVVPSCLLEPAWVEFCALLDERRGGQPPQFHPGHPLGCHRRKVPGRVVFEHVVAALVHGSGYERIATPGCSDRTIRRRLAEWADLGLGEALHAAALRAYDQIIGLELADVAVDGCLTKAPCGGERAGPSPVDRRKGGLKRSVASDGYGIPLGIASAGANRHDSPLLAPTLEAAARQLDGILPEDRTCHLDRGYDSTVTRQLLDELGFDGEIARKGVPAPVQAGTRWVVERTHSWMNGYGKLRRCTERDAKIVDFYLYLAAALVTIRQLIQRARHRYRWDTRPTTKRLKLPIAGRSKEELDRISNAEELQLTSLRDDRGLRPYVTMWVVRAGDDVYVRSAGGPDRPWYRRAKASGAGHIRTGGVEHDVTFAEATADAQASIDAAYHAKYDRYGSTTVGHVTGPDAQAVTIRLIPKNRDDGHQ